MRDFLMKVSSFAKPERPHLILEILAAVIELAALVVVESFKSLDDLLPCESEGGSADPREVEHVCVEKPRHDGFRRRE